MYNVKLERSQIKRHSFILEAGKTVQWLRHLLILRTLVWFSALTWQLKSTCYSSSDSTPSSVGTACMWCMHICEAKGIHKHICKVIMMLRLQFTSDFIVFFISFLRQDLTIKPCLAWNSEVLQSHTCFILSASLSAGT